MKKSMKGLLAELDPMFLMLLRQLSVQNVAITSCDNSDDFTDPASVMLNWDPPEGNIEIKLLSVGDLVFPLDSDHIMNRIDAVTFSGSFIAANIAILLRHVRELLK